MVAGLTDLQAQIQALSTPINYINGGAYLTLAQLYANFPASSTYDGMYANIIDLFHNGNPGVGGIKDVVRCRYDKTNNVYRWTAQREAYNDVIPSTGGAVTLIPLVTPPSLKLTGTLTASQTVTPSPLNAYVGQRFTVLQFGTLGLFTSTINGLVGSNLTLVGKTLKVLEYGPTGWLAAS